MYKGWIDCTSAGSKISTACQDKYPFEVYSQVRACVASGKMSVCGRRVIHLSIALKRFTRLPDDIQETFLDIFYSAIKSDCANSQSYLPQEEFDVIDKVVLLQE